MVEAKEYQEIYRIAILVSISCVLQIAESLIPHPIPGLRLGLANVMTLIALITIGLRAALEVAILRTILSSFIMGTFMSPAFILSLAGALVSTLMMGILYWLAGIQKRRDFTIVGISIAGAISHNIVQIYLAYLILVRHKGIFVFLPWLSIGALVTGWVTGVVAGNVCLRLKENQGQANDFRTEEYAHHSRYYSSGDSLVHRLPAHVKIISLFTLAVAVLIFSNLWCYAGAALFLTLIALISRTPFDHLFLKIKRYSSLILVSSLFPILFNSGNFSEGLYTSVIFASRLILLIIASSLLTVSTSHEGLIRGLARVLSPLGFLGVSQQRIAAILSFSWMVVPVLGERVKDAIRGIDLRKAKNFRSLIPILTEIILDAQVSGLHILETLSPIHSMRGFFPIDTIRR